jgi:hypothetical protein
MVIDNLDLLAMAILPDKATPPLVVDSDGMLPLPVAVQNLELVAGRRRKHTPFRSRVQL